MYVYSNICFKSICIYMYVYINMHFQICKNILIYVNPFSNIEYFKYCAFLSYLFSLNKPEYGFIVFNL